MATPVSIPGGRSVRASLDESDGRSIVVACPPHPEQRGHRGDPRLVTVSDALATRGIDCIRFDYGAWDEGVGEVEDARNALRWAAERYDSVGIFGYSFGGAIALLAAATVDRSIGAVSVLAPAHRLADELDAAAAVEELDCPLQVVFGVRDDTVDWAPVVDRATQRGAKVVELPADHFFLGSDERIGTPVATFFAEHLVGSRRST